MDICNYIGLNYHLKKLDTTSYEYNLVKEFYDMTYFKSKIRKNVKVLQFQICKVIENKPMEGDERKRNNLMLFHGTHKSGAIGILNEGFKNSKQGWHGSGVYMTECSYIAHGYATNKIDIGLDIDNNFIFVNEVLESEKLQTFVYNSTLDMRDNDKTLSNPFNKHVHKKSTHIKITEENYKKDFEGRKYRNVEIGSKEILDEFVAESSVTIPRYLIILKEEKIKIA